MGRTSPVEGLNKFGTHLWKLVISPNKSGENLKKGFWMVKHLVLSPNFFDASFLIVRLSYDSNKYKIFDL
jgi:hypothetical protein